MKKKSLMLILISVMLTMVLVVGCNKSDGNKDNKDVIKKSSEKKDYKE